MALIKRRQRRRRQGKRDRIIMIAAAALLAVVIAAGFWLARSRPVAQPEPWEKNVVARQGKALSVAWAYRPTEFDVPQGVDVQAPTWLYVEADSLGKPVLHSLNDMGYTGFNAPAYVQAAHEAGVEVWATVVSFDAELSRQVVADTQSRTEFVAALAQWARTAGVDGICFDFEQMDPADKALYTELVKAADQAMPGLTLAVAVTVPLGYEDEDNWYQCYDREGLAGAADYLALMCYDAHREAVQPVAPLSWVRRAVERTLATIPSSKVLLGIPFYGVEFYAPQGSEQEPEHAAISAAAMEKLLREGSITRGEEQITVDTWQDKGSWQEDWSVMCYEFTDTAGRFHRVWMEDARSLQEKGALMDEYGLAGAAVWQQSQGTDTLWKALAEITAEKEPVTDE